MPNSFPTPEIITQEAAENVEKKMSNPKDRILLKQVRKQQQLNSNQKTNVTQKTNVNYLIKDLNTQIVLLESENALLKIDKHELEKECDERLNELKFFGEAFKKCQNEKSELKKEKNKLEEENNRLKEESRGENSVSSFIGQPYNRNGVMEKMINNHKERGSVSGVWKGVKELVKMDDALDSKYSIMSKKKIMLDVARILTEIKITRSHWYRFEKFFNDKYRIELYYGVKLAYDTEKKMFNLDNEEIFKKMYDEFTTEKRIKIYKTLNGEIVNNTEKNYTNGRHFEYIPHRRLGEGVYRLGMGARKTKKKVAKSLSNSMKKAKKMFRSMTRKRGVNNNVEENYRTLNKNNGTEYMNKNVENNMMNQVGNIRKQVGKKYRNYNINNGTKERLGLDKEGSKGNSGPYQSGPLTTNKMTGHSLLEERFYDENRTRRRSLN